MDAVNTLNPGDSATVSVSFDGSNVRFTFGIPRGNDGGQGPPGTNGTDGGPGPQGPPFAQAVVDGVNTLNPGDAATVSVSFDGSNVRFTFGIPRGNDGTGANGAARRGDECAAHQARSAARATTQRRGDDGHAFCLIRRMADMELMRAKFNELVLALRR